MTTIGNRDRQLKAGNDSMIEKAAQRILDVDTIEMTRPKHFYSKEHLKYTHESFIKKCDEFSMILISKIIAKLVESANKSINTRRGSPDISDIQRCLSFTIASMLEMILVSDFTWDFGTTSQ